MKGSKKKSIWTPELVERLLKLWEQGLSAAEIARELGQGLSRNAVIGKVHRLRSAGKAPARRENGAAKGTPARKERRGKATTDGPPTAGDAPAADGALALKAQEKERPAQQPAPRQAVSVAASNTGLVRDIMELTHKSCRWPIGDPGEEDFCYCGRTASEGLPYCEKHAAVAYQGGQERKRA